MVGCGSPKKTVIYFPWAMKLAICRIFSFVFSSVLSHFYRRFLVVPFGVLLPFWRGRDDSLIRALKILPRPLDNGWGGS